MSDAQEAVRLSYGRALSNRKFVEKFYEIFVQSHPDIPIMFQNTDFAKQNELLAHSINMAILFADENKIAMSAIGRIRASHNRERLNINPRLYPCWTNSLMAALSEFDKEFTPDLERQWRAVLTPAIDHIISGH